MSHTDKRRWATGEQVSWLMASYPDYFEAQRRGRFDEFWPKFFTNWFESFPARAPAANDPTDSEPEPDSDSDVPADSADESHVKRKKKTRSDRESKRAKKVLRNQGLSRDQKIQGRIIRKRKAQVQTFMRGHCGNKATRKKNVVASSSTLPTLGGVTKPHRLPQETEAYMNLFYDDRIAAEVQARITDQSGPKINVVRKVAQEMYEKEDAETRAAVAALIASRAEEMVNGAEDLGKEPTPQQYQECIDALPNYMDQILRDATRRTGLSATLIMGGPIPKDNGTISTLSFHIGNSTVGATFGQAYRDYDSSIKRPYQDFLRNVYSSDVRSARALSAPSQAGTSLALLSEDLKTLPDDELVAITAPDHSATLDDTTALGAQDTPGSEPIFAQIPSPVSPLHTPFAASPSPAVTASDTASAVHVPSHISPLRSSFTPVIGSTSSTTPIPNLSPRLNRRSESGQALSSESTELQISRPLPRPTFRKVLAERAAAEQAAKALATEKTVPVVAAATPAAITAPSSRCVQHTPPVVPATTTAPPPLPDVAPGARPRRAGVKTALGKDFEEAQEAANAKAVKAAAKKAKKLEVAEEKDKGHCAKPKQRKGRR
ncbi:hypothetical protein FIBSPDRAFT_967837 [Athelia psychrophila]|uniref:Uncharacterized protein n=1 Tax=Athelia psychrophila TaxID=1759441 RepID=A0A167V979_9AGAM|nr:hypothetical protein FIBSPDRAFT_967837 [Fibularhizoctonia sp. CBS 109695]